MRKPNRSPRQAEPAVRGSKKKGRKPPIRQLSAGDDLGLLFSSGREDDLPDSFAEALASGIPAAALTGILTEKEELPTQAQSRPGAIRKFPPPQEQLDLHGCTAAEAEAATTSFLARARRNHLKTVLVITGKGIHSPEGPVLKDIIAARFKMMKNDGSILDWHWEKKTREESGALLVYLP
ncbi:MAG: Smr/MutS family protein [Desulfurivibrionaceae bacterium]